MGIVSSRSEDTLESSSLFPSVSGFVWILLLFVSSALALSASNTRTASVVLAICGAGYFGNSVLVTWLLLSLSNLLVMSG